MLAGDNEHVEARNSAAQRNDVIWSTDHVCVSFRMDLLREAEELAEHGQTLRNLLSYERAHATSRTIS